MSRPTLTDDEQAAFDAILDAMHRIQNLNGQRLRANDAELAQAVHVLQGFVIQSACGRHELFGCSDGWWEPAVAADAFGQELEIAARRAARSHAAGDIPRTPPPGFGVPEKRGSIPGDGNPFGIPQAGDFHCGRCQTLLDGGTDEPVAARELRAEVERLRAGLLECACQSGADVSDGIPTSPDVVDWAIDCVKALRADYDADEFDR